MKKMIESAGSVVIVATLPVAATSQFGSGGSFIFTNIFDSSKTQKYFILKLP